MSFSVRCRCPICRAHDELLARGSLKTEPVRPAGRGQPEPRDVEVCGANKHRQLRGAGVAWCPDCGERVARLKPGDDR